ncbi:prepilin peptidase [Liberiplasma polymorphum]|uniref:prepilin peptidase n=1 Tax=Liberiplasma polymorphum TaxID=3374570 RepID=UPI00377672A8
MIYIFVFLFSSLFTSFYTVVGTRLPKKQSILGHSQCDNCNQPIPWYGIIPLLGWFLVKGKCSNCKNKVSIKYPIYELLGGLLITYVYYIYQDNLVEFVIAAIFISLMIIVTVSDIEYQIVPDKILIIFLPTVFILRMIYPMHTWIDALFGGILAFTFMYFLAWYGKYRFKQDALGGGDIKLYFIIGLFLGLRLVFMSLFFASLLGIILGRSILRKNNPIPFVPFIFLGVLITYFFGVRILEWYASLL